MAEEQKEDLYRLGPVEREKRGIEALPHDLHNAIKAAEEGQLLKEVLGESAARKLIELKIRENDNYRLAVTQLELEEGLNL